MTSMVSETTHITANLLVEISQKMCELRTTILQTRDNTIYHLLLDCNLGCQQFHGKCSSNVIDFSHTTDGQINDLYTRIKRPLSVCPG